MVLSADIAGPAAAASGSLAAIAQVLEACAATPGILKDMTATGTGLGHGPKPPMLLHLTSHLTAADAADAAASCLPPHCC